MHLFKSAAHFLKPDKCEGNIRRPLTQTVCKNTKRSHITTKTQLGAAGKARNAGVI